MFESEELLRDVRAQYRKGASPTQIIAWLEGHRPERHQVTIRNVLMEAFALSFADSIPASWWSSDGSTKTMSFPKFRLRQLRARADARK